MIEEGEINYGPDGSIIGSRPSPPPDGAQMYGAGADGHGVPTYANGQGELKCGLGMPPQS